MYCLVKTIIALIMQIILVINGINYFKRKKKLKLKNKLQLLCGGLTF